MATPDSNNTVLARLASEGLTPTAGWRSARGSRLCSKVRSFWRAQTLWRC